MKLEECFFFGEKMNEIYQKRNKGQLCSDKIQESQPLVPALRRNAPILLKKTPMDISMNWEQN